MKTAVKRLLVNASIGLGFTVAMLAQPTYSISTVTGTYNLADNTSAAPLNNPMAVAVDSAGNVYFTDTYGNRVRKIDSTGAITTIAGDGTFGVNGVGGGGPAVKAKLWQPSGLALDSAGNLYIADSFDHVIEKVDTSGVLTVFAGIQNSGSFAGDGKLATAARIRNPQRIWVDSNGVVYIADKENNRIRKVTTDGMMHTVAGAGGNSTTSGHAFTGDGGPAVIAGLGQPQAVAVDSYGNVFVADTANNRIRMVSKTDPFGNPLKDSKGNPLTDSTALISTVAGGGTSSQLDASCGSACNNGTAGIKGAVGSGTFNSDPSKAVLSAPAGLAIDSSNNLYISDTGNNRILYLNFNRNSGCTNPAAQGCSQTAPVLSLVASAPTPEGIALSGGNLYLALASQNIIAQFNLSTQTATILAQAQTNPVHAPRGLAIDPAGDVVVADTANNRINQISQSAGLVTRLAGNGVGGFPTAGGDNNLSVPIQAVNSQVNGPWGGIFDANGNYYFADRGNNRVRMITAGGVISTVAGGSNPAVPPAGPKPPTASTAAGYAGDGLPALQGQLRNPSGVAVDTAGGNGNCSVGPCIYIADTGNNVIRKVDASGLLSTFAGQAPACASGNPTVGAACNGTSGSIGDGLAATEAMLNSPLGVAVDSKGNVYIADTNNQEIRVVTTDGNINIFSGYAYGEGGHAGDGGQATASQDDQPVALAIDSSGNVYFAEGCNNPNSWGQCENSRIRRVDGAAGTVSTLTAGVNAAGLSTGTFDDGAASTKSLALIPTAIAVDSTGNVYFGDTSNRIRKLTLIPSK